ncbi:MAG: hypothetical protein J2P33_19560 [Actinobacteria bacterium]|nr:hypothetical protein [Actinomycetota bacterium]
MLRWIAIAAAFVNLGIHLSMAPDHLAEKLYIGILFVIGSALLGAVMIGLASDRDRLRTAAWAGGALVCAAEVILFVLSRTTGLPQGYHEAWAAAPEDLLGLASLAVELLFIGCAALSLSRTESGRRPHADWLMIHDRTAPLP